MASSVGLLSFSWSGCNSKRTGSSGEFVVSPQPPEYPIPPVVAIADDGSFVVAWMGSHHWDEWPVLRLRRYDVTGMPTSDASFLMAMPFRLDIAMDQQGRFVVVGDNCDDVIPCRQVFARRFDSSGEALSDLFEVSADQGAYDTGAHVDMAPDGRFVVGGYSRRGAVAPCGDSGSVFVQQYDAQGQPSGEAILANEQDWLQGVCGRGGSVALLDDGGFMVVWNAGTTYDPVHGTLDCTTVVGRRFSADGLPLDASFVIDASPTCEDVPEVVSDGQQYFLVVWRSAEGLLGRGYTTDGVPRNQPFIIRPASETTLQSFTVDMTRDGTALVVWVEEQSDQKRLIMATRLDTDGAPVSEVLQVNQQTSPEGWTGAGIGPDGRFVVAWKVKEFDPPEPDDPSDWEPPPPHHAIYAQKYAAEGRPIGAAPW